MSFETLLLLTTFAWFFFKNPLWRM